jgi:hypothetical protein
VRTREVTAGRRQVGPRGEARWLSDADAGPERQEHLLQPEGTRLDASLSGDRARLSGAGQRDHRWGVCAVGSDGLPTFAGLTDALSAKRTGDLVYYVFDLIAEDTESLISYPLFTRKKALKQLIKKLKRGDRERVVYVDHHRGDGKAMHEAACKMGLEGIVSKRIDAPYQPNDRSGIWCKAKCRASQELVVGGGGRQMAALFDR